MVVLFAIVVIDLIGFGLVIPLLPFYGERFGASPFAVTVILAMYSLAQLFAAPLWGRLSDRCRRRSVRPRLSWRAHLPEREPAARAARQHSAGRAARRDHRQARATGPARAHPAFVPGRPRLRGDGGDLRDVGVPAVPLGSAPG